jgi:hypothetical protein
MRLMPPLIHGKIEKCLTLINWNWGIAKSLPDRARQAMKIIKKLTISRLQIRHGFEGRYSFRESFHLPAIIKEARSISGNRKGCEAACQALTQLAASLFQIKFDRASWSIEGI